MTEVEKGWTNKHVKPSDEYVERSKIREMIEVPELDMEKISEEFVLPDSIRFTRLYESTPEIGELKRRFGKFSTVQDADFEKLKCIPESVSEDDEQEL